MANLTLRLIKGSPLSHEELDNNFIELNQQLTSGGGLTIGPTEPINASQGDQWLDTTVDVVKIYDGSVWFEFPAGSGSGDIDAGTGGDDF